MGGRREQRLIHAFNIFVTVKLSLNITVFKLYGEPNIFDTVTESGRPPQASPLPTATYIPIHAHTVYMYMHVHL